MAKTFAYRRQEVVRDKPMMAEFKIRWPGLFTVAERRECTLRALCVYLNEDPNILFKEYLDTDAVERELQHIILGIYSINVEGGDATTSPADVGIVIEGVEVLHDLRDIASASALMMGFIYALNLSYPKELKAFFEVLQKVFLQLDASRLSSKMFIQT
ncbi:unnamed protein product [Pleuronectes platessa]|uniref:Uncharacterized protein n=1 Tax=Pleuronectes platessa TaxID=8262 RepID=A0A9N7VU80_PLEPL|nr:unnamed protein product [Pleuronectes platessa]